MAVVRITAELISNVLHSVSKQFDAAEDAAKKLRPEIGQDVYNIVLKDFLSDTAKIDAVYFHTIEQLTINAKRVAGSSVSDSWKLDGDMPVPYALPNEAYKWNMGGYGHCIVEINPDPQFDDVYERLNEWQSALKKVAYERSAARNEVEKVLGSFTTLAPALRAWPALWDLLPDHYRNKHKEIVERTKPEKVEVDTSKLDGLTAKLVMANINKKVEGK